MQPAITGAFFSGVMLSWMFLTKADQLLFALCCSPGLPPGTQLLLMRAATTLRSYSVLTSSRVSLSLGDGSLYKSQANLLGMNYVVSSVSVQLASVTGQGFGSLHA